MAGDLHNCDCIALLAELGVISHLKSNLSPYLNLGLLLLHFTHYAALVCISNEPEDFHESKAMFCCLRS